MPTETIVPTSETRIDSNIRDLTLKLDTWYKLNEHFQSLIVFADTKANFIISLSLWLLAWNLAILSYNVSVLQKLIHSFNFMSWVAITTYLMLIIAIVILQWIVFNNSISVVIPNGNNASKKTSVFYFGEVASLNHEDFKNKFLWKEQSELMDDLIYQVYDKAFIVKSKFELISKASNGLKVLLMLTVLHPIINIFLNLI